MRVCRRAFLQRQRFLLTMGIAEALTARRSAVRHLLRPERPVPAGVARRRVWRGNLPIRRADRRVRRVAGRIVGGAPQLSMTALAFRKRVLPGQPPRRRAITMRLLVRIRRSRSTVFHLPPPVLQAVGQRLRSNAIRRNLRSMRECASLLRVLWEFLMRLFLL